MKIMNSQAKNDCVCCAFAMVTGESYAKIRRHLKKRFGYSLSRKTGVKGNLRKPFEEIFPGKTEDIPDGEYRSLVDCMKGNKGIIVLRCRDYPGWSHAIAWSGFRIYDSNCEAPMFYKSYKKYAEQYYHTDCSYGFIYKTNWFMRMLSYMFEPFTSWEK